MQQDFDRAIPILLRPDIEGGLVDDPHDPGGLTQFGISARAYPNVDIRALTPASAADIYRRDYWPAAHGDALPWPLCLFVFDHAVNAGAASAMKCLQRALGTPAALVDGVWGPRTAATAAAYQDARGLADRYLAQRVAYYLACKPELVARFGVGWCARVAKVALAAGTAAP